MKYRVIIQPPAEVELEEAYLWIRADSPEHAARWRIRLLEFAASLERFPRRCPRAPESRGTRLDIRQFGHASHRVLYLVKDKTVHILHIQHAARLPMTADEIELPDD